MFKVFQQVVDAVEHLHSHGYAHHDLKPSNILVDESFEIRLIDFGLVEKARKFHHWGGTAAYMPPEYFNGAAARPELAYAHDVWSLGIIFYEMYFGFLPYKAPHLCATQQVLVPDGHEKPNWVISLLKHLLAYHPENRPSAKKIREFLAWVIQTDQLSDQ